MLPGVAPPAEARGLAQGKTAGPLEAANMLWLIQRDFLQGASVQAMVTQALQPVPNAGHDADIDQARWARLLHMHCTRAHLGASARRMLQTAARGRSCPVCRCAAA